MGIKRVNGKTMKAAYLERRSNTDNPYPTYGDVPRPAPSEGEILIWVHATSIMPTERGWRTTWETQAGEPRTFPIILGHEFAGLVAAMGATVRGLDVGEEVYGMNDWDKQGAQAEYCITRPEQIARMPGSIGYIKAAAVPISALTAWQALVEHGQVKAGQRVLIHGGSGSVGAFAVQIARSLGAYVITTASTEYLDLARSFGPDEVIDYSTTRFEDVVQDVDLVLDTVGHDTQERSWSVLKPGGILVSIVHPPSQSLAAARQARGLYFIVKADHEQLGELAHLIDSGKLKPLVAAEFPLDQVREAYAFASEGHHGGKTILRVTDQ
jgi:NADPH:quinone reductase-like Zn-dependent oxidoreductase